MTTTFTSSPKYLLTCESVTEGHPDKICDQVSDALLDAILAQDPDARVACDCMVTTGLLLITGEITTTADVDYAEVARETILDIGYTDGAYGLDGANCGVIVAVKKQSGDIAQGVDEAAEHREEAADDQDPLDQIGAGDQGIMIGFACNETPEYMPLPISLAHRICRRLAQVRKEGTLPYLRPDGKSQVTVEYRHGQPVRVDSVICSAQHAPDVRREQLTADLTDQVIKAVVPGELLDDATRYLINPTGRFVTGGPKGDAGLTGRKNVVDTYGSVARHGGGAFSGKDPTKVDRSGCYMARYVAKNLVAAGLADRLEIQISYAIGVAHPTSVAVETFDTGKVSDAQILELIEAHFDLRPAAIIADLELRRPIYRPTAAYGHFGRDDMDAPWERLDKVESLQRETGL